MRLELVLLLGKQLAIFIRQNERREKVGSLSLRQVQLVPTPPARDALVVPGLKDSGNVVSAELARTRVVRMLQDPGREALALRRALIAENARMQPRNRVHHHQRSELAPGDHEIAHGQRRIDSRVRKV